MEDLPAHGGLRLGQPLPDGEILRVGVVGTGRLGREHARIYRELRGVELAGVADTNPDRAGEVGRSLGVPFYRNPDELWGHVHAVSVAVPTAAHARVAESALRHDVHVLVEKPITATVVEADRLVEIARERGLVLGVGHVERHGPAAQAFLALARNPRFIECHRLAPFNPRGTDVPVVLDLMIHDLDMLLALAPGDVTRVDAVGVPVLTPMADIANARLVFSRGLIANLTASRISRDRLRKMRLFQPDCYLSLDYLQQRLEVYRRKTDAPALVAGRLAAEQTAGEPAAAAAGWVLDPALWIEHEVIAPQGKELLRLELEAFVEALRHGRPAPVTGEDGRRALALAERIMRVAAADGARGST